MKAETAAAIAPHKAPGQQRTKVARGPLAADGSLGF